MDRRRTQVTGCGGLYNDRMANQAHLRELLGTARRAAEAGVRAIEPFIGAAERLEITEKGLNDFVTRADHQSEQAIADAIRREQPRHVILAEENLRAELDRPEPLWIIDPLDGTTNFIHGFPVFSVSVACAVAGCVVAGVVIDPTRHEVFEATRGGGAAINGLAQRVTSQAGLQGALIGTGFPFRRVQRLEPFLDTFRAVFAQTAGIRRAGSAALDLSYVACGRLDGFWEEGLGPWDMAAGSLMIEEAGGVVTDFLGGGRFLQTGAIVAGAPGVHRELRPTVERWQGDGSDR